MIFMIIQILPTCNTYNSLQKCPGLTTRQLDFLRMLSGVVTELCSDCKGKDEYVREENLYSKQS